jgi:hypothetical protein
MSKEKKSSKLDKVMPSIPSMQLFAAKLDKNFDQTEIIVPPKQVFSQELINRLTDRIKEI